MCFSYLQYSRQQIRFGIHEFDSDLLKTIPVLHGVSDYRFDMSALLVFATLTVKTIIMEPHQCNSAPAPDKKIDAAPAYYPTYYFSKC
jgi:hypothetical protein